METVVTGGVRKNSGPEFFPELSLHISMLGFSGKGPGEPFFTEERVLRKMLLSLLSAYAVINKSSLSHFARIVQVPAIEDNRLCQ